MSKVLFIDNYDSFSYNIIYLLEKFGFEALVIKDDEYKSPKELEGLNFSHIIISPGPNAPKHTNLSTKVIKHFQKNKKILGICLGHQCLAYVSGGKIAKLKEPKHGKTTQIKFKENALFRGLKQNFKVCLYHSLYVKKLPKDYEALAYDTNNVLMALKHKKYDIYGVQFHPEAILSQGAEVILLNFLRLK
ncbi:glutamine amidotransferase [Campylobacter sp. MIT 12-8780]|uniref:anthranilate synthase component II n=1 Tax=unclassified Campylobacter TaxID=2593542 RepID=UPI00115C8FD1|nr:MULTISPECIES: aminodeoxychorismate/anthranilate synthase component II [unclassified Campylobacter]NDJ26996.1 aminodeoxychorismate/anthranilate synthase component II [Campylobacter sp. MIT 19-121]TQR41865.1 glutamine amidotransferase [Campylobacter sp. MIT 12-8780]